MITGAGVVGCGVAKMIEIASVGVADGVKVGVFVGVREGGAVGEGVRLNVALRVAVAVRVKVRVGLGVMLAAADGVRVAVGVLVLLGALEGVWLGLGVVVMLVTPADGVMEGFAVWVMPAVGVTVIIVTPALGLDVALAAMVAVETAFEVTAGLLTEVTVKVCWAVAEAVLLAVTDGPTVALSVAGMSDAVKVGLGEASALIAVPVMGVPGERLAVVAAAGVV